MSLGDINDILRRIDRTWQLEYQRSEDLFRYRMVDADGTAVLGAMRRTFLDLGMPVQAIGNGAIIAENEGPTPLSGAEWAAVAKAENPRLLRIAGPQFILAKDPRIYVVIVKATVRDYNGKALVILDYALELTKNETDGRSASEACTTFGSSTGVREDMAEA